MNRLFFLPLLIAFVGISSSCCNSKIANSATSTVDVERKENSPLVGTYWKLTELMGKPVSEYTFQKEPFMRIEENMHMTGSGGCNSMHGSVEIKEGNRIQFGNIATTLMACMEDNLEAQLLQTLKQADNYSILGNQLSLNKAKMAPLARFEAVEKQ